MNINVEAAAERNRFYIHVDGKTVEGEDHGRYVNFYARATDWPLTSDKEQLGDILPDIVQDIFAGKKTPPIRRLRFYKETYVPAHIVREFE